MWIYKNIIIRKGGNVNKGENRDGENVNLIKLGDGKERGWDGTTDLLA